MMVNESEDMIKAEEASTAKSCGICTKFNVCYIIRELQTTLIRNNGEDTKPEKLPVNPFHLAWVCREYEEK